MKRYGYKVLAAVWMLAFTSACLAQYNPDLGRFHQRDPLGVRPGQATFVNGAPYLAGNGVIPGVFQPTQISPTHAVAMAQPDPVSEIKTPSGIAPAMQYSDGMNAYEYVVSSPMKYKDEYGTACSQAKSCKRIIKGDLKSKFIADCTVSVYACNKCPSMCDCQECCDILVAMWEKDCAKEGFKGDLAILLTKKTRYQNCLGLACMTHQPIY